MSDPTTVRRTEGRPSATSGAVARALLWLLAGLLLFGLLAVASAPELLDQGGRVPVMVAVILAAGLPGLLLLVLLVPRRRRADTSDHPSDPTREA
jgi:hypothetical protein